jgi:hypothetical protein
VWPCVGGCVDTGSAAREYKRVSSKQWELGVCVGGEGVLCLHAVNEHQAKVASKPTIAATICGAGALFCEARSSCC